MVGLLCVLFKLSYSEVGTNFPGPGDKRLNLNLKQIVNVSHQQSHSHLCRKSTAKNHKSGKRRISFASTSGMS